MRFSLQEMVRRAVDEADRRTKLAEAGTKEGDGEPDKDKRPPSTPPDNKATAPERNETSMDSDTDKNKTSSVFVEKLASAVEYLNSEFFKGAAGVGEGPNTIPNNLDSRPGGHGKQSYEFGQATDKNQPPKNPGSDVKSKGQTNPGTALETDMNNRPGGSEDWTKKDIMKQSSVQRLRAALDKIAALPAVEKKEEHEEEEPAAKEKKEEAKEEEKKAAVRDRILNVMNKMAGEDVAKAHIAAGAAVPPDASKSEEGVPSQPAEVNKQKALIYSIQAAINYTKQQAKAVPKAQMGEVIDEPAQRKSTDPVLHQNLDAASKAGVKLSSVKLAAARALLQKVAEEGAKPDASPEEKERAAKLQAALEAKRKDKEKQSQAASEETGSSPLGGGY
jgi:hypothetical protein